MPASPARAIVATLAAVLLAGFAAPPAPPPSVTVPDPYEPPPIPAGAAVIKDPIWVSKPAFADYRRAYPVRATGGSATLVCQVTATGALTGCVTWRESEPNMGYGEAALRLAPAFAMRPTQPDAAPVAGAYVTLPIYFDLDAPPPLVEASAETPGARMVKEPNWVRRPTAWDFERYYPFRAIATSTSGDATARCVVTYAGSLSQCVVIAEDPPEFGFGDAALRITRLFRMRAWTADGRPVEGAVVDIPVRFLID